VQRGEVAVRLMFSQASQYRSLVCCVAKWLVGWLITHLNCISRPSCCPHCPSFLHNRVLRITSAHGVRYRS